HVCSKARRLGSTAVLRGFRDVMDRNRAALGDRLRDPPYRINSEQALPKVFVRRSCESTGKLVEGRAGHEHRNDAISRTFRFVLNRRVELYFLVAFDLSQDTEYESIRLLDSSLRAVDEMIPGEHVVGVEPRRPAERFQETHYRRDEWPVLEGV